MHSRAPFCFSKAAAIASNAWAASQRSRCPGALCGPHRADSGIMPLAYPPHAVAPAPPPARNSIGSIG